MIPYQLPESWMKHDRLAVMDALVEAKAAILALRNIPYQRGWAEALQQMELKREVAGTSRIEGAEFTERELDEALAEPAEALVTRSQKQARAAVQAYRWIATLPLDRPFTGELIREIHHRMVTGCDDDHCAPGGLRNQDENVNFGLPRHRGANGGEECRRAFELFSEALTREFPALDPIIQALAAHYHLAAMHPFLDGNGRAARALEALMLQRAGLRDTCFIAMSNYYYDEKTAYLAALSQARAGRHDLTPFLLFGLKGIARQTNRLLSEIKLRVQKEVFANTMHTLFNRLKSTRKRVIAKRQVEILKLLLEQDSLETAELINRVFHHYAGLKNPEKTFARDMIGLEHLGAIGIKERKDAPSLVSIHLEWPTEITETDFLKKMKSLPKARTTLV